MNKKRFGALTLVAVVCAAFLFGCGKGKETIENTAAVNETETEKNDDSRREGSGEDYVHVIAGFGYKNDSYIVFENVSDSPILNVQFAFMSFDDNGFLNGNEPKTGSADNVNLMPGDKTIISFYGDNGKYIKATASHIDFSDNEEWDNYNVDGWFEQYKMGLDIDEENKLIEGLAEDAQKATTDEYVKLE